MKLSSKMIILFLSVSIIPLIFLKYANNFGLVFIVTFILTVIFTTIVCISIVRTISRPIEEITIAINEISRGNFNVEINPETKKLSDEIGDLARAFDRTFVSIKLAALRINEFKSELATSTPVDKSTEVANEEKASESKKKLKKEMPKKVRK
ncbi:HAMP domain-containing protein [Candidatus Woesearchaeota archaeon]|nr:HAMP domain-containing protein [Candidatus Woesearchaeota archaeon]